MHCFKRLGERVMARTFECQVTELHVRVALLNRFTQLDARQRCLHLLGVAAPRAEVILASFRFTQKA